MTSPIVLELVNGRTWLRVADAAWDDPLDPSFAAQHGGRWNPPGSFPTLYLNADLSTARSQIRRLLDAFPADPEDLDPPYVLVMATLPRDQTVADGVSDDGLAALDLPRTYPFDDAGTLVAHADCQQVGALVHDIGLRGIRARSAASADESGRELAWFPARRSSRARPVASPMPFYLWWPASRVEQLVGED